MDVDESGAITTAIRFFAQQHSDVFVQDAVLEDDVWTITALIGLLNQKTKKVRIDAESGKILSYDILN